MWWMGPSTFHVNKAEAIIGVTCRYSWTDLSLETGTQAYTTGENQMGRGDLLNENQQHYCRRTPTILYDHTRLRCLCDGPRVWLPVLLFASCRSLDELSGGAKGTKGLLSLAVLWVHLKSLICYFLAPCLNQKLFWSAICLRALLSALSEDTQEWPTLKSFKGWHAPLLDVSYWLGYATDRTNLIHH